MNFSIKKVVTAVCMAAFIATSFMPGTSEASNRRMSLAQAQQEMKQPLQHKYPHYKPKQSHKIAHGHRYKSFQHRSAMHTRGPVSQTWVPVRNAPPHHLKKHSPAFKAHKPHPYRL